MNTTGPLLLQGRQHLKLNLQVQAECSTLGCSSTFYFPTQLLSKSLSLEGVKDKPRTSSEDCRATGWANSAFRLGLSGWALVTMSKEVPLSLASLQVGVQFSPRIQRLLCKCCKVVARIRGSDASRRTSSGPAAVRAASLGRRARWMTPSIRLLGPALSSAQRPRRAPRQPPRRPPRLRRPRPRR